MRRNCARARAKASGPARFRHRRRDRREHRAFHHFLDDDVGLLAQNERGIDEMARHVRDAAEILRQHRNQRDRHRVAIHDGLRQPGTVASVPLVSDAVPRVGALSAARLRCREDFAERRIIRLAEAADVTGHPRKIAAVDVDAGDVRRHRDGCDADIFRRQRLAHRAHDFPISDCGAEEIPVRVRRVVHALARLGRA